MGIGFVLFAYVLILMMLAIPVSIGIFVFNFSRRKKGKDPVNWARLVIFSTYPFIGIAYIIFAIVLNGLFCEYVRGVDPGFGDGWEVPIKNGYKFCMIDDTKSGYIMKDECSGSTDLAGITKINIQGDSIYGEAKQPFVFNLSNGEFHFTNMDADWKSKIEPKLKSANDFYGQQRGHIADMISLAFFAFPPVWLGIRKLKKKKKEHNHSAPSA